MVVRVPLTMPATFTSCSADDRTSRVRRSSGVNSLTNAHSAPSHDIFTLAFDDSSDSV